MLAFFVFVAFFFTAEWKEKVLSTTFVQRDKLVSAKVSPVIRDSWILVQRYPFMLEKRLDRVSS